MISGLRTQYRQTKLSKDHDPEHSNLRKPDKILKAGKYFLASGLSLAINKREKNEAGL